MTTCGKLALPESGNHEQRMPEVLTYNGEASSINTFMWTSSFLGHLRRLTYNREALVTNIFVCLARVEQPSFLCAHLGSCIARWPMTEVPKKCQ
jgi:hypothetical protein